jgi:hypothetical protein
VSLPRRTSCPEKRYCAGTDHNPALINMVWYVLLVVAVGDCLLGGQRDSGI